MNSARDIEPTPMHDLADSEVADQSPQPLEPLLADLSPESSGRIVRYIVTSTLEHGVAPNAVVALYADLAGDQVAVRYADRRFMLREVPRDWREVENRVVDLETTARERGLDLAAAWRRATGVAMHGQDALEQLARLAGAPTTTSGQRPRSIFDDPEDLDALEDDFETASPLERLVDRQPQLIDLTADAQQRIRRFAIEERLERGLPPVELIDLYRGFENAGDQRAQQYLDRVYVDREPPLEWVDIQSEAGRLVDMAEARGRDAGRLYADLLRTSPALEAMAAMRILMERLERTFP
jgi:hypothetical protein